MSTCSMCPLLTNDATEAALKTAVCEALGSYNMDRIDPVIVQNNLQCCMTEVGVSSCWASLLFPL